MTDPNPDTTPDELEPEQPEQPDTTDEPDTDEPDEWEPPTREAWAKLQDKAKRRDEKLREAQAKIRELEGKPEDTEPSEADVLRSGMIRTAGRAVLAGAGITDKADQSALLDAIKLDGIEVDSAGEVDTDELESRIGELRRILGAGQAPARRIPRTDTRDKGGRNAEPTDPDTARYRRIMAQKR